MPFLLVHNRTFGALSACHKNEICIRRKMHEIIIIKKDVFFFFLC